MNGEKDGYGVLENPDGEIYEGEWKRNLREGSKIDERIRRNE